MIANGDPIEETARQIFRGVEDALPGVICSILTVDHAGLLHPLAAPNLPDAFNAILDGMMIGPEMGSCGAAAYLRTPVAIEDVERDPRCAKVIKLLVPLGLKACWSVPVGDAAEAPIGVAAIYYPELCGPGETDRAVMASCIELCEVALRRHARVEDRERRANVDALTGLPNRSAFNAAMAGLSCDIPGSWALFIVDLDNLKVINDTFGHLAGDALIRTAASRISRVMSPDVTFRLGGDEFAIIVQNHAALVDLDAAAEVIFNALEVPSDCEGHMVVPKATIGGAVVGPGDLSATVVNQNADFALYHAKETGRGGFVRYWPGIGTRITHRRDAIRDVTAALREGRIDAYYQPILRLDSQEIVSVEALCRMRTPEGVILPASAFQEATCDAHVAAELTNRMFSIVAADVRRWLDDGIPFRQVGVNISAADFYTGSLMGKLEETFGRAGVPLHHLFLEVKEEAYMGERDRAVAREIKALRDHGVSVVLDDFGTGYASLTHLITVPVDAIKIDRSFIARLWPDDPSLVIVEALIDIARKLDISVVAEGIETEVQASQLWAMGCKLGQGFAFSKAVDRHAMEALLRRHAQGDGALPMLRRDDGFAAEPESAVQRMIAGR